MGKGKKTQIIYLIIGLLSFCYVLIRAISVGITYDEVWTMESFVSQSVIHIINYTPSDANNHILNTLLIKLFLGFGNHSLFIARLPNVLAFILYAFYGYKIFYKYLPYFLGLCGFLLLLVNPFVLDFFSVARGYGLGLGFLMASIYFVLNYAKQAKTSDVLKTIGLGAIAVLCNFSILNYFISLVVTVNAMALYQNKRYNWKKTALSSLIISIILVAIIYEPIRKLKGNGNLYYGGNTSFYSDTLVSLAKYSFYSPVTNSIIFYALNIFLAVLISSVLISFLFNRTLNSLRNIILSISILSILSIVFQHYLFGTLYLIDRTALFFYPLFIVILYFSLNEFSTAIRFIISIILVSAFSINFFNNANLYKTAIWYFDAHSTEILNSINEKGKKQNRIIAIDFSWPFQSSFGYYVHQNKYPYIEIVKNKKDREGINPKTDYYIYLSRSLEKVGYDANNQKVLSFKRDTLNQFAKEHIVVFENIRK